MNKIIKFVSIYFLLEPFLESLQDVHVKYNIHTAYLKFKEFWNIEGKCKNGYQNDIHGRMATSYTNPQWVTYSKVPLQTYS